jgi:hypothetical protein
MVAGRITGAYCITTANKLPPAWKRAISAPGRRLGKSGADFTAQIQGFCGIFRRRKISEKIGKFFRRRGGSLKVKMFKTILSALS